MKNLILILSVLIFSLNGFTNEFEGRGWTFSNEVHFVNFFEKVEHLPKNGLYLSVGGDRAFTGAAMARQAGIEIDGVINIDRDPKVLRFATLLPMQVRKSKSPTELFHALAQLPEVSWFTWLVVMLRHYSGLLCVHPKSIYLDDKLFSHLHKVSSTPHLRTYNLDFNNLENWQPLLKFLDHRRLKIAVLDISNVLDGYVSPKQLALVIKFLAPYFSDNAVIVNTQFCTQGVGHIKTHVHHFADFVYRLKGRTRASLQLAACISQNIPGW